jgi:hypothetical protein
MAHDRAALTKRLPMYGAWVKTSDAVIQQGSET